MRRVALPVLLVAALAGCGGSGGTPDRVAFYQLATIDGLMRANGDLSTARVRLKVLEPRDPTLRQLRDQLAAAAATGRTAEVRHVLEVVYTGLLRFQRAHPEVAGLVPD